MIARYSQGGNALVTLGCGSWRSGILAVISCFQMSMLLLVDGNGESRIEKSRGFRSVLVRDRFYTFLSWDASHDDENPLGIYCIWNLLMSEITTLIYSSIETLIFDVQIFEGSCHCPNAQSLKTFSQSFLK
uniref:Multidrug resistance protein MdtB n=1 Tax=Anthurium amnicola TaxID=1678845 RepID=A0A1D1XDL0_9ARAE